MFLQKLLFLGDVEVGKTSIIFNEIYCYSNNEYPTIGIDFFAKNITYNNQSIKYQIWDTSGNEKFSSMLPLYVHTASICMIVYDITSRSSFDHLDNWIQLVLDNAPKDVTIFIVGNKNDLESQRTVSTEEGQQYAREHNAHFFEMNKNNSGLLVRIQDAISGVTSSSSIDNQENTNQSNTSPNQFDGENKDSNKDRENKNQNTFDEQTNTCNNLENDKIKNFLISASGLKNILFDNQVNCPIRSFEIGEFDATNLKESEFRFIIGKYEVITNRFFAEFISPRVSHLHHVDPTINSICLNDFISNESHKIIACDEIFNSELIENFKKIITGEQIEIDLKMSLKLRILGDLLENEEISNKMKELFIVNLDLNNLDVNECLNNLDSFPILYEQDELINLISSKFYSIDMSKLLKLSKSTLYLILSNQNLILNSEDSLFDFINELFKSSENKIKDDDYDLAMFYELIDFNSLSDDKIHAFIQSFDHNCFTNRLWQNFTKIFYKNDQKVNDEKKTINNRYIIK